AARTTLLSRYEQFELFDRAFDLFWKKPAQTEPLELGELLQRSLKRVEPLVPEAVQQQLAEPSRKSKKEPEIIPFPTYDPAERLAQKDFADLTDTERQEVEELIEKMNWGVDLKRTRRLKAAKRGKSLDLRRMLRDSLRQGQFPGHLRWRTRKLKRRPLVVLCDISGSMEVYSRIFLKFIYVLTRRLRHSEAFVFGTRLTRITHQVRERSIDRALQQAMAAIHDWGGGTRIGEALKTFNFNWTRRVLTQGAVVLIISDGWDRGDVEALGREMDRLQRSCHRLIWLNPLLGSPSYEPLSRGIQAALPYVDDFLPVHNLNSLRRLAVILQKLR
ncbi:MAG TPA: VWA domain-containing protein, partial [Acidobacteriota bacterium]|nr:VWA domain-containing protein [Acidobacteriota bacterium]